MKQTNSKFFEFILSFHKKIIELPSVLILGLTSLFCVLFWYVFFGVINRGDFVFFTDSISYFTPQTIDLYRPPIYPMFLRLVQYFSPDNLIRNVILIQHIVYFLSIIPFFFLSKKIFKNVYLTVFSTICYGCTPFLITYNVYIIPECFSIVGSVIALYLLVAYIEYPTKWRAFLLGIGPFILILLKPVFLLVPCMTLLFFIFRYIFVKQEKTALNLGMLGIGITTIGVVGFCGLNKAINGEFTLSKVALHNNLGNIILSGAYVDGDEEELVSLIDGASGLYTKIYTLENKFVDNYKEAFYSMPLFLQNYATEEGIAYWLKIPDTQNYSTERLNKFVKNSQLTNTYYEYTFDRFVQMFVTRKTKYVTIAILLELLIMLWLLLKYRKIEWVLFYSIIFTAGIFSTVVIGAIGWGARLIAPAYPFIIIVIVYLVAKALFLPFNKDYYLKNIA